MSAGERRSSENNGYPRTVIREPRSAKEDRVIVNVPSTEIPSTDAPSTDVPSTTAPAVAVVIPAFNEQREIAATLHALRAQSFDDLFHREVLHGFRIVVVDNNSTDDTARIVGEIAAEPGVPIELISEPEPGTGCAVDTGFRHAIDTGAIYIARTDADTLPAADWLANLLIPLMNGQRLVGGRVLARNDAGMTSTLFNLAGKLWRVGHAVNWWKTRKEPDDRRRSFAVVGNNMAIDAEMYRLSGGFPRSRIDELDEDAVLQRRVRAITGKRGIALRKQAVVRTSMRRLSEYGAQGYVEWYRSEDRGALGRDVDIR